MPATQRVLGSHMVRMRMGGCSRVGQHNARQRSTTLTRASLGDAELDDLEEAIPKEQRPMNELKSIQSGGFLNPSDNESFTKNFGGLCVGILVVLGGPISAFTFDPVKQTLPFIAGGVATTSFLSSLALIRTYLGWSYVYLNPYCVEHF